MPERRDVRHPHVPPEHVRDQIAEPEDGWDTITPALGVPATAATVNRINDRTKQVLVSSRNTEDRVGQISAGFHALEHRVGGLSAQVGDLQRTTGSLEGKLDILTEEIGEDRRERRQLHVTAVTAQLDVEKQAAVTRIEIDKTDRLAAISERHDRAAHRRTITLRAIAFIASIVGVIEAILLSGRC